MWRQICECLNKFSMTVTIIAYSRSRHVIDQNMQIQAYTSICNLKARSKKRRNGMNAVDRNISHKNDGRKSRIAATKRRTCTPSQSQIVYSGCKRYTVVLPPGEGCKLFCNSCFNKLSVTVTVTVTPPTEPCGEMTNISFKWPAFWGLQRPHGH